MGLSLKVNVDEIPEAGKLLSGELPQEWAGPSLLAAYTAAGPLSVRLEIKRYGDNVHVQGQLGVSLTFECSRTLEPGTVTHSIPVSELFQPASASAASLAEGVEADAIAGDEPFTFEGHELDVEPLLREALVLSQDPYPTVTAPDASNAAEPVWSSPERQVDPRWAKLAEIRLDAPATHEDDASQEPG